MKSEKEFFSRASVNAIIPERTDTSIVEALEELDTASSQALFPGVKRRQILFFDEKPLVYLSLEVPKCSEERLQSYLARLELNVDVWVVANQDEKTLVHVTGPMRDLVFSTALSQIDDPITLLRQNDSVTGSGNKDEEDEDGKVSVMLLWEVPVTLNRPRARLSDPSIVIVPSGYILPEASVRNQDNAGDSGYDLIPAFAVPDSNVLEPLRGIPGFEDEIPFIPTARLEKVLPLPPKEDNRIRIKGIPSEPVQAYPAAVARMKYTRINSQASVPTTIASLDIDVIPFVDISAKIEHAKLSITNGRATPLMEDYLPMDCRSKDSISLLYSLQSFAHSRAPSPSASSASLSATNQQPNPSGSATTSMIASTNGVANLNINAHLDVLSVSLRIAIHVSPTCRPIVSMDWTTSIDFSQALNPTYGPPSQPIQRTNRPASLPFGSALSSSSVFATPAGPIQASLHPQSQSLYPFQSQPAASSKGMKDQTLTISFLSEVAKAKVGVPFTWRVLVVNNSSTTVKLAIVPLPRIQRTTTQAQHYAKRHAPKASNVSFQLGGRHRSSTKNGEEHDVAQAVLDENVIYAMQHSGTLPSDVDIMSLTAELRVGPLATGQCHESRITLIAFQSGCFTVDAMRVVDLLRETTEGVSAPGVVTDIRDLPDVIVEKA